MKSVFQTPENEDNYSIHLFNDPVDIITGEFIDLMQQHSSLNKQQQIPDHFSFTQ